MQTKEDISYGVIPITKEGEKWKTFLINQVSLTGGSFWGFPKGHPEEGESRIQTVARELKEETGLVADFPEEPSFNIEYNFSYEGIEVNKKVVFFVGLVEDVIFNIDNKEVTEAGWFDLAEVVERLDYKDTKEMFSKVIKYIETL